MSLFEQLGNLPSLMESVNRSPLVVNSATSVAEAIGLMSRSVRSEEGALSLEMAQFQPNSCVIITERDKLLGILTERDIVQLTADQRDLSQTLVSEVMTQDLVTLAESNSHTALTALSLFFQHRIRHLPIVDDHGRLLGLLTPEIVRQVLQPVNLLKLRSVEEVMIVGVIHAPATAMVLSIAQQMSNRRVSCIVIAEEIFGTGDSEPVQQRPIGMITERDIVQYQSLGIDLANTPAQVVMSAPVFCVQPQDSLWQAQQAMETRSIRRLVVTNSSDQILGIVTPSSLVQKLDPLEVLGLVDILQRQVLSQTAALQQTNWELEQTRQQLEQQVAARSAELYQRNLQLQSEIQQHQRTESALLDSQQDLRDFVDNAVVGLHWVDGNGTILWANQAELDLLGYASSEYIGHSITEFHVDGDLIADILQRLLSDQPVQNYEAQLRCKDGSICDVSIDSNTSRKSGEFSHTRCFTRDITDRKSMENALLESERKFRAIFDGTFQFVGLLDTNGVLLEGNRTALNAIGVTSAEVVGQLFWETPWWTHSPDLQVQLRQAITRAATGQLVRFEAKHFLADGSYIIVDFSLSPIFDENGKVVMLIPEGRDISDRKAAEQKIQEQAMLLNIATDAILVRDLEHHLRFWSDGAERIYGWSAAEAIGQDIHGLLYRDDLSVVNAAINSVLMQGAWQGELRKVHKSGRDVIVQSRWTLVRDESGIPKEILSVDTDITEKIRLETQFLRAQRLESLGTLASGIAHDMNNILTPILAISQLLPLKLTNLDDRSQSMLKILEESAKRGTNLIQQILSFGRGSDGTRASIQISHLLAEVVRVARQTFPKSIDISINLPPTELYLILADGTQLHQVLMNLLINARDAMTDGGKLQIIAENLVVDENYARMNIEAKAGAYVVVTVTDTGTGMPPAVLERIFEPFFTTKETGKGTGLGLSTTVGIVKSHGGFISVYSDLGQGTCFKIYLPAAENSVDTVAAPNWALPIGNRELVLVVDDEVSVREITKASLETYNYRVITAMDGVEAIALYAQKPEIQFILLDLMMPSLDSVSTIRALRRINSNVLIVAMSGLASNEPIKNMGDANVQAFLAKPFTSQELLQTLHQLKEQG